MSGTAMRTSIPWTLVALALSASLVLAGCGGDEGDTPDKSPDAQNTAAGSTLSGQWPLTGLKAEGAAPEHPAFVVKIDNSSASEPQVGLSKADLVAEQLVEGGSTRLAVFYYSQLPDKVGPVRSFRATDIGIVKPADAVLVASGGARATVRRMKKENVSVKTSDGAPGFSRDNGRPVPYNVFVDLPQLAGKVEPAKAPPENYFPWGKKSDFPAGQKASGLDAVFSAGHTTRWQFRGGKYVNLNSFAAEGDVFTPDTVLVLRVRVGDAGYKDPAGNPVPETKFNGRGRAMIFHGGTMVRGTWSKSGLDAALRLETLAGPLTLPPGKVWMELVPAKGGKVSVTK